MKELDELIETFRQLLIKCGYGNGDNKEMSRLSKGLRELFVSCLNGKVGTDESKAILLNTYQHFNEGEDIVQLKFIFKYDPVAKTIEFDSLLAAYKGTKYLHVLADHGGALFRA